MKKVILLFGLLMIIAPASFSETYDCTDKDTMFPTCCTFQATCTGDFYSFTSLPCKIQCYENGPRPGQIILAGSADCSPVRMCEV